ncbi:MAG: hypothetical protein Q7I99_03995 [Acholeplasmataceae bacterium]|nr:hypothetical protein [Acholeplasmataceae bacterium]
MKKPLIFIILFCIVFISFSINLNSQASIDGEPGINIYIVKSSNNNIEYEDIHIEIMVLKSDFSTSQISPTITDVYKELHPNYLNYSHLEDDTEISYLAHIKETRLNRGENEISFINDYGVQNNITYLRLVMFTSDGNILARSALYEHISYYSGSGSMDVYHANFDNHTFSQSIQDSLSQSINKLIMYALLMIAGIFLGVVFLIWASKVGLSTLLKVKYKNPSTTRWIDAFYIFFGIALSLHFYGKVFNQALFSSVLVSTLIFLIWNAINFFALVERESRKKYLVLTVILYIIICLITLMFVILSSR